LSTNIQYGNICKITPNKGTPWYCNDVHILTLKHTVTDEILDISIPEYYNKNNKFKHCYKQFSVGVDFQVQITELPINPYFLGIWFGDGNKSTQTYANGREKISNIGITTLDVEVKEVIEKVANEFRADIRVAAFDGRCPTYYIKTARGHENKLLDQMRYVVGPWVTMPRRYLTSSRTNRLEFLAGLIDSDGHLHNNCYEICQKRKDWAEDIAFLARSLGFKVTISMKYNKQHDRHYHRIGISGDVDEIPVKINRKKAQPRRQKKDPCKTGFIIEAAGQDYYVGIELDGDGRYLLGDFTVTHNTLVASMLIAKHNVPSMVYVIGKDLLYQFHKNMEETLGTKVGIIGDGLCQIRKFNVCSVWTAITAFNLKTKVSLDDEDWSPEVISVDDTKKEQIREAIQKTNLSIFDEAHFLATDTLQSVFKASKKCRYLFGLSGTDWRDDGADLLLESVCGERIYNMPSSKLIEEGFLVPPNIVLLEVPPYVEELPKHYPSVYSKYITKNEIRNGMIIDSARKLIDKGKKVLILVRYLSHGNELAKILGDLPIYFVNGDVDSQTRISVKRDFENGDLKCLIASSVFDIGVDIPSLDALILAGGGKSTVRTLQRIGRVIRICDNKKNAIVVDFIDNARYLDKHSATRIAVYETEPRFKIKFPKNFDRSVLKTPSKIIRKVK
jgi:superfamily II DNA or RNA helicase